jgi:hypothetical protein
MLEDVESADAKLEMYELPSELVLSMSALFLGYLDYRDDQLDNFGYAEQMLAYFATHHETACLSLIDESAAPCALGFISDGKFKGMYAIAERAFGEEPGFMRQVFDKHPHSKLAAYILPSAMTTDSVRFGYSLTSNQFANKGNTQRK